jgi:hypothetical protein
VATAAGAVPVQQPRVNDRRIDAATGERMRFSSAVLPTWGRKSPGVAEVLPLLYLHGLSSGDFVPALEQFLGSAAGLSAATVTRLTAQWQDDTAAFGKAVAAGQRLCVPVGRRDPPEDPAGAGQGVPAGDDRGAGRRHQGAGRALRWVPRVVGRPAAGLQAPQDARPGAGRRRRRAGILEGAARSVPDTREQRCWFHVQASVLAALSKSARPGAKAALAEIYNAEDNDHALAAAQAFEAEYGVKWPKAPRRSPTRPGMSKSMYQTASPRRLVLKT